jgi:hypothetical protein
MCGRLDRAPAGRAHRGSGAAASADHGDKPGAGVMLLKKICHGNYHIKDHPALVMILNE